MRITSRLFIVLVLIIIALQFAKGQRIIKGQIVGKDKEALPFVNIILNQNEREGVIADLNGQFKIEIGEDIKQLSFSYVGYETLIYHLKEEENFIIIQMQISSFALNEAIVFAGENPAHRIIRLAIKNKNKNDPNPKTPKPKTKTVFF